MTTALRLTGPSDLIAAVPYLIGFHPESSLVLIGLNDGHLIVTARINLSDVEDCTKDTLTALVTGGVSEVVALVYSDACAVELSETLPWASFITELDPLVEAAGLRLTDPMLVCDGRFWSYHCADRRCCPPEGREIPGATTPFEAEAVALGMTALPKRDALLDELKPLDVQHQLGSEQTVAAERAFADAVNAEEGAAWLNSAKRAIFAAARDYLPTPALRAEFPRFAVALRSSQVRDAVWLAIDGGRIDGHELWQGMAINLPAPYNAAPLFFYGWRYWRAGDGTRAGIAAQRALESDPTYSAADLLLAALARGVNPIAMPKLHKGDTT